MEPTHPPRTIGRYEIVERLGYGGMGVVYRARDPRIGRPVAVKMLRVADERMRERFLHEAQSAGSLKHRNIVTIFDYGDQDGQSYIVMEFVEGLTLADQIKSNLPLSLSRKLELIEELATGLDYAHNRGIVHRDVKPANVMIDRDGVLKILDFGIARVADSSLTQAGMMMGTPNYMSPEQIEGGAVDRRSDIFAVGLVCYELLSYRQAFSGDSVRDVMNAIVQSEPTPLLEISPGLDPQLAPIVERAIQKRPANRYKTLALLASDVARIRGRLARRVTTTNPATVALATPPETPARRATPRLGTDREELSKRRAERIDNHLRAAQEAFDAAKFAAAIDACEQAAMLDPDDPRVLDLLDRSRDGLENDQLQLLLNEARAYLADDDVDRALAVADRITQRDPSSAENRELRAAIAERQRQREEEQRHQQAELDALIRARASLSNGDPEMAIRAASEVLIHNPANEEAHQISRQAIGEIQERRTRQLERQAATAVVEEQRRRFAAGEREEAIAALARHTPSHEVITAALVEMRAELSQIQQRVKEEAERRRREEVEAERRRQTQRRWVERQLDSARTAMLADQFIDAIEALEHVQQVSPDTPELAALLTAAREGQSAAEAAARQRQEIDNALAGADAAIARGQLVEARSIVDAVLTTSPDDEAALAKRAEIQEAIDAEERRQARDRAAADAASGARRRFERGEHDAAIGLLESFSPPHPLTSAALAELKAALAEIKQREQEAARQRRAAVRTAVTRGENALARGAFEEALAALDEAAALEPENSARANLRAKASAGLEAARQAAELERRVQEAVAAARAHAARGNETAAIQSLERFQPPVPLITATLLDLRATVAAREERARQERKAREQAEAERAAREMRVEEQIRLARAEFADGNFEAGIRRLNDLTRAEGDLPRVHDLITQARADHTAEEELRRREAREAERRALELWARQQFDEATAALQRDDPARVLAILEPVPGRLAHVEGQIDVADRIAAVASAARKRLEVQRLVAEAREHWKANAPSDALAKVDEALDVDPTAAEAIGLGNEIRAARRAKAHAELEAARQAAELERRVRAAVAAAHAQAARGDEMAAIQSLEQFQPVVPEITATLVELRAAAAAREERLRTEREARERAEAERAARLKRIEEQLGLARAEISDGNYERGITRLNELTRAEGDLPGVRDLIRQARADQTAAEELRRREAREAERKELEQWARQQLAEAKAALKRDDPARAVELLEPLTGRLAHAESQSDVTDRIAAVMTIARKRLQTRRLVAEAREQWKANAPSVALAKTDAALRLDPTLVEAIDLGNEIRAAIEERARRELEQFKADRKAAADQARLRGEQVEEALERAKTAASPRDAVLILQEALRLDPRNKACLDLLSTRQAELLVTVDRLVDNERFDDALQALDDIERIGVTGPAFAAMRDRVKTARAEGAAAEQAVDEPPAVLHSTAPAAAIDARRSPELESRARETGEWESVRALPPTPVVRAWPSITMVVAAAVVAALIMITGFFLLNRKTAVDVQRPSVGLPILPAKSLATALDRRFLPDVKPSRRIPHPNEPPTLPASEPISNPSGTPPQTAGAPSTSTGTTQVSAGTVAVAPPPPGVSQPPVQNPGSVATALPLPTPPPVNQPIPEAPPRPQLPAPRVDLEALDRAAIRGLLAQYAAASNALDAQAVARLVPSSSVQELRSVFANYVSQQVTLSEPTINIAGDTATATCTRRVDVVLKRGNQKDQKTTTVTFSLRRSGGSWAIEGSSAK